jgi:hypothetical protein
MDMSTLCFFRRTGRINILRDLGSPVLLDLMHHVWPLFHLQMAFDAVDKASDMAGFDFVTHRAEGHMV